MFVNSEIGNLVSVMDGMRAGILVYTTEGLYVDTLLIAGSGAPGYRKGFDFGSATVYNAGGEDFGYGQIYLDKASGKVLAACGKTTVMGFEVEGWSAQGIATTPVAFVGGPSLILAQSNIAEPPGVCVVCGACDCDCFCV